MKKFLSFVFLVFALATAWAIPRPEQIEQALAAQDYVSARSMVNEVLRKKPTSARAHLLNAYVLLKEKQLDAAANEVKQAKLLDSKGDVSGSALFGRTVAEIDATRAAVRTMIPNRPAPKQVTPQTTNEQSSAGFCLIVVLVLALFGFIVYRFNRRSYTNSTILPVVSSSGGGFVEQPQYAGHVPPRPMPA